MAAKKRGTLKLHGKEIRNKTPREAVSNGFALLTEERRATGIFGILDIQENTTISSLNKYLKATPSSASKMKESTDWSISAMHTKTPYSGDEDPLSVRRQPAEGHSLGGGCSPIQEVLLLDEPTRGIDVGAKYEIYQLIIDLANEGKTCHHGLLGNAGAAGRMSTASWSCPAARWPARWTPRTASQEEIMTLAAKYV